MIIRTKIVATIGPACGAVEDLREMARAGADVFRINFSHGSNEQHDEFLRSVREVEAELGEPLAVMGDLCGPKIRVGAIIGGGVLLGDGQELVIQREPIEGTTQRISTTLAELIDAAEVGQAILLDDGRIRLRVASVSPPEEITCTVIQGGVLASSKGVNLPSTALPVSALTEKDRRDVAWLAGREFDYVALSFVREADDVRALRELLEAAGCGAHIVAKIEKPEAVEHIEEIAEAADAVMVARGDLGVEMDLPAVPVTQKRIARLCQREGKCCIIATQMLETMTHSPTPTRAEVSDVANAVLDHADAVMLSGETAVGRFPVAAVRVMNDIVRQTQSYHDETAEPVRVTYAPAATAAALASAVREIIEVQDIAAVAVYTATGTTARMFAKSRLPCPILGISQDLAAVRRMCLYYGVVARQADAPEHTRDVLALAEKFILELGIAEKGDRIAVVSGRPIGEPGATNTLVVHTIA
ncbi:MAG: pyruvate kinase [Phycisphaerae bacterium]